MKFKSFQCLEIHLNDAEEEKEYEPCIVSCVSNKSIKKLLSCTKIVIINILYGQQAKYFLNRKNFNSL